MKRHHRIIGLSVLAALTFGFISSTDAQSSWAMASSGNWNNAGNWSPAGVPGNGASVTIGISGTYTVTYDSPMAAASIGSFTLGSGSQTLTITAPGFHVSGSTTFVDSGSEIINVNSGGVMNNGTLNVNSRNGVVNINTGGIITNSTTQVANNNSVDGATSLKVNSGATANLGAVTVGRHTRSDSYGLQIAGGNVFATSIDVGIRNSYSTMAVSGGNVVDSGNLRFGTGSATAGRETRYRQTGGTVTVGGTVDIACNANYTVWFNVLGASATLQAQGIRIFPNSVSGAVARLTNSGSIFLGASGFNVLNSGSYTVSLNDQSVLGASADWSGNVNFTAPGGTITFKAADAAGVAHDITLLNPISGGANLAKTGGGTLTLKGANTFSGNTIVSAGRLLLGNANALPKATALTLGGSGTMGVLDLAGFDIQIDGLAAGSGGIAVNQLITNSSFATVSTLTFSNSAADSTFGGRIAGGNKPVALTVLGGNLTLASPNNYAGNLFISNGKLALAGAGSTFTGTQIVLSNTVAVLDLTGMNSLLLGAGQNLAGFGTLIGNVTASNCPVSAGVDGVSGTLNITGNLTLTGGVTNQFDLVLDPNATGNDLITVSGALNVSGVNAIKLNALGGSLSAGTYTLIQCASIASGGAGNFQIIGSPGPSLQAAVNVTAGRVELVVTQVGGTDRLWAGDGIANAWDHSATNWLNAGSPDVFSDGNVVTFDDSGSVNPAINLIGMLKPNTVTVDAAANYIFGGSGKISGPAVLTKTNSGTLIMLTENDYTGLTVIQQGTLQVGNGGTSGALGSAAIRNDATLIWNQSDADVLAAPISGTGRLVQAGSGSLTLGATNTYSGGTLISAGTLQIATGGSLGAGNLTNNAALVFKSTGNNTIAGSINGSGSVSLIGGGTVTLSGDNSFTGGTIVSAGTLLVNNATGSGTGLGAVTVSGSGQLSGNGPLGGAVTINSGGSVNPGNPVGTLSIESNFTANPGASFNFALGSSSDRVAVSGNLNLSGTVNLTDAGGLGNGTYTLFTYGGNLAMGNLTLGSVPPGKLYQLDNSTPGQVNVIVGVIATNVPAFPGALGFGSGATGGRGGKVYHVTTLADSGTGSFRDAVSASGRTVVFDVGGYIALKSAVSVKGNLTIAGQTAPGGGIGFKGGEISFANSANIICRHIRIRPGSDTASSTDDCLSLYQASNIMLDHVSLEFGPWNNIDAVGCANITVQNSIDANPTGQQFGAHTESVGQSYSWFYNIFANSHNRNPLAKINTVFINNINYNYSAAYTTHTSTPFKHDLINNYFICGPASGGGGNTWFQIDDNQSMYFTGNLKDASLDGVMNGSTTVPLPGYQGGGTILASPWSAWTSNTNVVIYSPQSAYRVAVSMAGALPRDEVDALVLSQVKRLGSGPTGTGAGTAGPDGGLYTSQTQTGLGNNGYGTITGGAAAIDSDDDGMPDYWEDAAGLDASNLNDSTNLTLSGYTQLEIYLNWLAEPHAVANTNVVQVDLVPYATGFTNANPTFTVSSAINGGVALLPDGHTAQFSTPAKFVGRGSFEFVVAGNDGTRMTNSVGLVVSDLSPPQDLVWQGNGIANIWDAGTNALWLNGNATTTFNAGDAVTFDDSGSAVPAINLTGTLKPSSVTVAANQDYTFSGSGTLSGATALIKSGSGTLTLTVSNTFTGGSTVSAGTLRVNNPTGSATGAGDVEVASGAMLSGSGTIGGSVFIDAGATLSPGDPTGTLTVGGDLTLDVAGASEFTLGAGGSLAVVVGNLSLAGTINVSAGPGFGPGTYTIFTYGGALNLGALEISAAPAGYLCQIDAAVPGNVRLLVSLTAPQISNVHVSGGNLIFSGAGGTMNGMYYVLSSTNVALPTAQWSRLATNLFDANGNFAFTNDISSGVTRQFYLLEMP